MFFANHFHKRQTRIDAGRNYVGVDLISASEHDAFRLPVLQNYLRDGSFRANLCAGFAGRVSNRIRDRAGSSARQPPGSERAVDLAHVVVQQNVSRAGAAHAQKGADDSGRRHRRLEHISLKPLVEKIDGAHRHQLHLVVLVVRREFLKATTHPEQFQQAFRIQRGRIGRRHIHDWLDEVGHLDHRLAVFVVSLGIEPGMPGNLAPRLRVIVDPPQVVTAGHRREGAVERENLQAMTGKIEFPNDLRAEQGNDVRTDRELESGENFFRHARSTEYVAALEHEHTLARARQIRGIYQSVVATADDDDVVFLIHALTHPLTQVVLTRASCLMKIG